MAYQLAPDQAGSPERVRRPDPAHARDDGRQATGSPDPSGHPTRLVSR
ncbi:MAG: hypothetical protein OEV40_06525 [Acidimicrobiia bacterium]|nr:hypothetical protein [Acidimicrobiia bacterium]